MHSKASPLLARTSFLQPLFFCPRSSISTSLPHITDDDRNMERHLTTNLGAVTCSGKRTAFEGRINVEVGV
ncbi:hypothetical protein CPC08DRAFT_717866 [Agrocybe pediades]|nr:hypothetical protein CPC08DRAFT_717866 [Agrocybe pediades]